MIGIAATQLLSDSPSKSLAPPARSPLVPAFGVPLKSLGNLATGMEVSGRRSPQREAPPTQPLGAAGMAPENLLAGVEAMTEVAPNLLVA